jgi:hypothetical protein
MQAKVFEWSPVGSRAFLAKDRLGWDRLAVKNTLTYNSAALVTALKSFIVPTPSEKFLFET